MKIDIGCIDNFEFKVLKTWVLKDEYGNDIFEIKVPQGWTPVMRCVDDKTGEYRIELLEFWEATDDNTDTN